MKHPLTQFARFMATVARRMKKAGAEYGDRSWSSSPVHLIAEVKQEVEDIAGWSFILWHRLDEVERRLSEEEWAREYAEEPLREAAE